jgi:hypothetical protein
MHIWGMSVPQKETLPQKSVGLPRRAGAEAKAMAPEGQEENPGNLGSGTGHSWQMVSWAWPAHQEFWQRAARQVWLSISYGLTSGKKRSNILLGICV